MPVVSIVIPNFNGLGFLPCVLGSLRRQSYTDFEVILVDNGSSDASLSYVKEEHPWVRVIALSENTGFARAVNLGISDSRGRYVVLLNNDTEAEEDFLLELVSGMERHPDAFAAGARMMAFYHREEGLLDDAGNYYCVLGWAFARGKGKKAELFQKEEEIFSACAGAAIYRRELLEKIGGFDENHFAYLEDVDLCYRARLYGYSCWYLPRAAVYHVGSGTTGSRYNPLKVRLSSRNNLFLLYKNMPLWQRSLNFPFLFCGSLIKLLFFIRKGMGRAYLSGLLEGFTGRGKLRKTRVGGKRCLKIEGELFRNLLFLR